MDSTSRLYFLQIDNGVVESPLETEAIPFSMVVKKRGGEVSIPVARNYNGPCTDGRAHNFINPQISHNIDIHSNVIYQQPIRDNGSESISTPLQNETNVVDCKQYFNESNKVKWQTKKKNKINRIVHIVDRVVPPRAVAVLPPALYLRRGSVVPRRPIPACVKFGPVEGICHPTSQSIAFKLITKASSSKVAIFLMKTNDCITFIDVSDHDKSNWFGLLPLGSKETANLWLYQEDDKLFAITTRSVNTRSPLLLGYSKQYADAVGIPATQPVLDISDELSDNPNRWWCTECDEAFTTVSQLQHHINVRHKVETKTRRTRRGRFRCTNCGLTYTRFFSLKRHMTLNCSKSLENYSSKSHLVNKGDIMTNPLNYIDDSRIPSDESLQNFTSGLDFSTSLFDTDRISNLDISGSSKSDAEFNPYGIGYGKHDNLNADLEFPTDEDINTKTTSENKIQNQANEPLYAQCPHCKQSFVKEKLQQHKSECVAKNLKCECGSIFFTMDKLTQHIRTHHKTSQASQKNNKDKTKEYKCEKCHLKYLRRGMFVNHMWRVHKSNATVPVERRVLHYPCVACPKLYRTASKRDRHVRTHHPGVELVKGSSIESGTKSCEPAACPACPRQYVTRAKLLQHLRAAHPDLAPPLQQSGKSKASCKKQDISSSSTSSLPAYNYNQI